MSSIARSFAFAEFRHGVGPRVGIAPGQTTKKIIDFAITIELFCYSMHITQLHTFLAVTESGSFHLAAERLNITQAAVSARIRQLETILDVRLFDRGRRGAALTEAGRHLRPHAESITRQWRTVLEDTRRRFSGRVFLRLGSQLSIWDRLLVDLTIWIETKLDKLPLTVNFDHDMNMHEAVRNGILDLALTHELPVGADLAHAPFPAERLVLVADKPCSLHDTELPLFVNFELGAEYDAALGDALPKGAAQHIFLGNCTMGLHYLRQRGGMAYAPQPMVQDDLQAGRLVAVRDAPDIEISCHAVYDPESPAAELVKRVLEGFAA
ncbi:LysR family transcriptional regulator [Ostreiculturibacter nitratireducens]|uniref:LysR family transcriptional regulator n=1 Tax=Ostreiculturibacter nitratireducens TaxID=3075226 RepID=UPI0031B5A1DC